MQDTGSPLRDRLAAALTAAMKRRDATATQGIRLALAAVANAEAVAVQDVPPAGAIEASRVGVAAADVPRRQLTEDDVRTVVMGEIRSLNLAAGEYHCLGSHDEGERLLAQAEAIRDALG